MVAERERQQLRGEKQGYFRLGLALLVSFCGLLGIEGTLSAQVPVPQQASEVGVVWGNIQSYSGSYVQIDGRRYDNHVQVVIDTYSLKPDKRGNTRIKLDEKGKVREIFFFGIDMPEVVKNYRR